MRRLTTTLAGVLVFVNVLAIGPANIVEAAPAPPAPDCSPDPTSPPPDPPVGTGSGSISGIVGVAGGDTLEGVTVEASDVGYEFYYSTQTDASGVYTFAGLEEGNWFVSLASSEYPGRWYCQATDEWTATSVSIEAGAPDVNDVNILVGPGAISGTIDSAAGFVEGATVTAYDTNYNGRANATTGPTGTYQFDGLDEGDYRIQVQAPGGVEHWLGGVDFDSATPVVIQAGNYAPVADMTLPTGEFAGVVSYQGSPVAYTGIVIYSFYNPVSAYSDTDENGAFSFQFLPAGDYFVQAYLNTGTARLAPDLTSDGITSQTGLSLVVPTGSIEGVVSKGGVPIDGTIDPYGLRVVSTDYQINIDGTIEGDGSYVVGFLPDGDYIVEVTSWDTGQTTWYPSANDQMDATIVTVAGGAGSLGVDVDIPTRPTISGTVHDQYGDPVAGAYVEAYQDEWWAVGSTSTGPDGTYSIEVDPGTYRGAARPQGGSQLWYGGTEYADATDITISPGNDATGIDFTVTRAGFTGTVSDANGPLAYTWVTANDGISGAGTSTDENGYFAFEFMATGTYQVSVSDPTSGDDISLGTAASDGSTVVTGLSFTLPTATVSGVVTQGGAPVDGSMQYTSVELVDLATGNARGTSVDGVGDYQFGAVADGDYQVRVNSGAINGGTTWYPNSPTESGASTFTVSDADVDTIDVDLPAAGVITGTVTDPNGVIPFASVIIYQGSTGNGGNYITGTTTDSNGVYRFDAVAAGQYTVSTNYDGRTFYAPGTFDGNAPQVITVLGDDTQVADITIPMASTLSGTVTGPGGAGLGGVAVNFAELSPYVSPRQVAITNPDGTYTTDPFYESTVRVEFQPDPASGLAPSYYDDAPSVFGAIPIVVPPGSALNGFNAQLEAPGAISGTVTTPASSTSRAVVRAWDAATTFDTGGAQPYQLIEAEDGFYEFTNLPAGQWIISASPWYDEVVPYAMTYSGDTISWDTATVITVTPGGNSIVDIQAQVGQQISGTVTGPDGSPIAGAVVNASPFGHHPLYEWRQVYSNDDGSFTLPGLAPGDYRFYTGFPENVPWILGEYYLNGYGGDEYANITAVTVPVSGPVDDIDVQLDSSVGGSITILGDAGPLTPDFLPNGTVPVLCPAPEIPTSAWSCSGGSGALYYISQGSTAWHLVGLFPGAFNIAAVSSNGVGTATPISVELGAWVSCDLGAPGSSVISSCSVGAGPAGGTISGTVLGTDGQPQPGVVITLHDTQNGHVNAGGYTAEDGTYTANNIPPGTYRLYVIDPHRIGQTEPSLTEWWSPTGDVYDPDYLLGAEVTVTAGSNITDIDVQLDLPATGTVQVGDGVSTPNATVIGCQAPYEFDAGASICVDPGTGQTTYGNTFGENVSGTTVFQYMPPGTYDLVAVEFDPFTFSFTQVSEPFLSLELPANHTFECVLPLLGEGSPTCEVTPVAPPDDDDGVTTAEEDAAPNNGDGNDDGTPDSEQSSVASVEDPTIIADPDNGLTNYITLSATVLAAATPLTGVQLVEPPEDDPPPPGATPQSSLISFEVNEIEDRAEIDLEILLPEPANSYYKYDPIGGWTDATELATFHGPETVNGITRWRVVLHIKDNEFGDDNPELGAVSDPGLFALTERNAPEVEIAGVYPDQIFIVGDAIEPECLTTDVESGVATPAGLSIDPIGTEHPDGVGSFTVSCSDAADQAGNVQEQPVSLTYHVRYRTAEGIFTNGSAAASPAVNIGNAGRTYPLHWTLQKTDGSFVTDINAVTDWSVFHVPCEFISGEEEPLPPSTSSVWTDLSIDANGTFKLRYKTDKTDECTVMWIWLVDGGTIIAKFDLR